MLSNTLQKFKAFITNDNILYYMITYYVELHFIFFKKSPNCTFIFIKRCVYALKHMEMEDTVMPAPNDSDSDDEPLAKVQVLFSSYTSHSEFLVSCWHQIRNNNILLSYD